MRHIPALVLLGLALAPRAHAQATRVADLNRAPAFLSSNPSDFVATDGGVLFFATDRHGRELWRTDGTVGGTSLFLETGYATIASSDHGSRAVVGSGGTYYLTDGTSAGTLGFQGCSWVVAVIGDTLLCEASAGGNQYIYSRVSVDGGIAPVANLGSTYIYPWASVQSGAIGFRRAQDAGFLWTDGVTFSPTTLQLPAPYDVAGLLSLPAGSVVASVSTSTGTSLMSLEGTPSALTLNGLIDLPWYGPTFDSPPLAAATTTYLTLTLDPSQFQKVVVATDGTAAGTRLVLPPRYLGAAPVVLGDRILYIHRSRPWPWVRTTVGWVDSKGDGGWGSGVTLVGGDQFVAIFTMNGRAYALSQTGVFDLGPDGTAATYLGPFVPAPSWNPLWRSRQTAPVAGGTVFATCAGPEIQGCELGITDGTVSGTGLLADLWKATLPFDSDSAQLEGDSLVVVGSLDAGDALCRVALDGGDSCTLTPGLRRRGAMVASADGWLLPIATPNGPALAVFHDDGGQGFLDHDEQGQPLIGPDQPVSVGTQVIVSAGHSEYGIELFSTRGTATTTRLLVDVAPGPANSFPSVPVRAGSKAFFSAEDGKTARSPWVTDGTAAGTLRLDTPSNGLTGSFPSAFTPIGDAVAFAASTAATGRELYVSDGTPAGTRALAETLPGPDTAYPEPLGVSRGVLVARGSLLDAGMELLLLPLDGGPVSFVDLQPGPGDSWPKSIGACDGGFLFSANVSDAGREPWFTDGTPLGTRLLQDLLPGPDSSDPGPGLAIRGRVYFAATTRPTGRELFVSDGTPGAVALAAEVSPGTLSSDPAGLSWLGSRLTFTATDTPGDRETWSLPLPPSDDNTPPRVTGWLDGRETDGGWFVTDVQAHFVISEPDGPVALAGCDGGVFSLDTAASSQTCTATSFGGATSVTLSWRKDSTPPVLTCPSGVSLEAGDAGTAEAAFQVTAVDAIDPHPLVTSSILLGSPLGVGRTPVTATAVDAAQNVARCQFEIEVRSPPTASSTAPPQNTKQHPVCGCGSTPSVLDWLAPTLALAGAWLAARRRTRQSS